jgi:hypothetical protein
VVGSLLVPDRVWGSEAWQAEGVSAAQARWWDFRRAQNLSAAVYRCPLCDHSLPALAEHMLITPEGDGSRRRHAHVECVAAARRAGRLPTRDEWRATQPTTEGRWRRFIRLGRR